MAAVWLGWQIVLLTLLSLAIYWRKNKVMKYSQGTFLQLIVLMAMCAVGSVLSPSPLRIVRDDDDGGQFRAVHDGRSQRPRVRHAALSCAGSVDLHVRSPLRQGNNSTRNTLLSLSHGSQPLAAGSSPFDCCD
jgi:hypothetical protein